MNPNAAILQARPDYAQLRDNMVDGQLRTNKVTDHNLIRILRQLPREEFLDVAMQPVAYIDEDLVFQNGRFMLEPMVFARLIQSAEITKQDRVLDVGCGYGYSTACIAQLAKQVTGIDQDPQMLSRAKDNLQRLCIEGDYKFQSAPLLQGYPQDAPYDVILVNGACAEPPLQLFSQLNDGGRLVCVLKDLNVPAIALGQGKAMLYIKTSAAISGRALFDAASPYIENPKLQNRFVF